MFSIKKFFTLVQQAKNLVELKFSLDTFWTHFGHILGTFWAHFGHIPGCPAALLLCQFEKVDQVSNQTKFVNFGFSLADQSGYSLPFS